MSRKPAIAARTGRRRLATGHADTLSVLNALWQLFHALEVRSKRMKRTMGVTGPQRLVVRVVGEQPDTNARAIADALAIDPSTLTGILGRLEAAGLVERSPDPADGRRARFRLTRAGKIIDERRRGTIEEAVRRTIASFPRSHAASFRRVVNELIERLEDDS